MIELNIQCLWLTAESIVVVTSDAGAGVHSSSRRLTNRSWQSNISTLRDVDAAGDTRAAVIRVQRYTILKRTSTQD